MSGKSQPHISRNYPLEQVTSTQMSIAVKDQMEIGGETR